jgi:ABC-type antimicrobial peptide transport system permease subunit
MGIGLALVGLYGLVSYAVNRQTREIGIRMAIGAAPRDVLTMVLRRALVLTGAGLVLGGIGSAAAGRALNAALPGLGDFGIVVQSTVIVTVFAVAALAAYIPARRAAGIDPLGALRTE